MKFKKLVKAEETDTTKRKLKIDEWLEAIDDELYYLKPLIEFHTEKYSNRGDKKSAIVRKLQDAYSALLDIEDIF